MKKKALIDIGFKDKATLKIATILCANSKQAGLKGSALKQKLKELIASPDSFLTDPFFGELARAVVNSKNRSEATSYNFRDDIQFPEWGEEEIDSEARLQMKNACSLPVAVNGALMPDAHVGYGLPIGGVLATDNAVIPYAVGVDIACRVMMSVYDLPVSDLKRNKQKLIAAIDKNTSFGIGAKKQHRKEHAVMDADWSFCKYVNSQKDLAWQQLGTSGSGNHFVEFGLLKVSKEQSRENTQLPPGEYVALVSHSGSRGPGNRIATHYSKLASTIHSDLPKALRHLAWLSLDSEEGAEYWAAMELMGSYASANHHIIHDLIARHLNAPPLFQVENHHNFAWKEQHEGCTVVVHRKGATPAGSGELGYIPGSMTAPGFLVRGRGNPLSLNSCSHGAGRVLSRKKAKATMTAPELKKILEEAGVHLISAGLDEAPHAYKDIRQVMAAQNDLVDIQAVFYPKIVKMAPAGEKPED